MVTRLLVVDDDDRFRDRLVDAIRTRGLACSGASDAAAAYDIADAERPDGVVIDLRMDGISGLDAIPELRRRLPDAAIVVLTGFGSIATTVEALRRGANDYLVKPIDVERILGAFAPRLPGAVAPLEELSDPPTLGRVEWEHIQRVMNECGGNVSRAARALGMHRRSLQRKLNKYPPPR
jgi:two-component system response regulator RegA